jgi:hypothetical protein
MKEKHKSRMIFFANVSGIDKIQTNQAVKNSV